MARAVWTGAISFGLVSVGVKALSAVHDHDVHFHQIERSTGSRIGNEKVSKDTGKPVKSEDIDLGYEVSKGRYVTFDPDEVAELRPRSTRTIDVSDFVQLDAIDPVFYERTYWLAPTDEGAERAYRLLAAAMEETQQVGIGTVVMRNKQYLAAIRPIEGALAMSTMRFADEVVDIADLDEIPSSRSKPAANELKLATQIIDSLATDWKPERYHDTFTEELRSMIEAKDRGDEITVEDEPEPTGKVIDLMAALEASVAEARSGRSRSSRGTAKKTTAKKPAAKGRSTKKTGSGGGSSKKASAKKSTSKGKATTASKPAKRSPSKQPARKSA